MDRISKLKEFLAANPTDSFVQHALALEYIKGGDDVTARQHFEQLLAREPDYVGSYYHLGKLLERMNEREAAIGIFAQGIDEAKKAGDNKAHGELQTAYEELTY